MDWFRKKDIALSLDNESSLAKCLTLFDLTFLGVGAIIGAGIFILTGVVAATQAGPAVIFSYIIAGFACTFAALSYAELAATIGGCGSAYGYAYAGFGELIAWIVGWDLLLEYSISVSAMLQVGRDRLLNEGLFKNIRFVQGNAQCLPFADNSFHCITMGFGLRNVTDKEEALRSMYRVAKPGGKLMILEFSTATAPGLKPVYDWYSFHILPKIGKLFAEDEASYQYLAESIRMHPNQVDLKDLIEKAGFEDCQYHNLTGGIVALHIAYKY